MKTARPDHTSRINIPVLSLDDPKSEFEMGQAEGSLTRGCRPGSQFRLCQALPNSDTLCLSGRSFIGRSDGLFVAR